MPENKIIRAKAWLWTVIFVVLTLVVLFIWQRSIIVNYGRKGGSKPHLSVKQINVRDIGDDRVSMTARIMVSNPLLVELKVEKLECELLVDSVKIMQTEFIKQVNIKSLDSVMLTLPIEILRDSLVQLMNRFERNDADSANYTLKAKLHFKLPVAGEKTYEVEQTKRGPAFRFLKLKTEDIDIEKFGFRNSDLSMSLLIENPNAFEIAIKDIDYDLFIGKDFHMQGEVKNVINIPAHSTISLPLEMDVKTKNIPRLAWQVLFEKEQTPFHIDFTCKVVETNDAFKDTRIRLNQSGSLDELKKRLPEKGNRK